MWQSKIESPVRWLIAALLLLVAVKLWLVQGLSLVAQNHFFDDLHYLDHGRSIINGQWLGAYDANTLVKGPGYPLWIAFNFFSGLPLLFSQHLLHIFACFLLICALWPFVQRRYWLFFLFVALLFDPNASNPYNLRVMRDFLYSTQHIFVVACLIGILAQRHTIDRMFGWALGLGMWLAFHWLTREEGVLLLPAVFLLLSYTAWLVWREQGEKRLGRLSILLMPLAIWAVIITGICALNYRYYGVQAIIEQKAGPFTMAMTALQKVKQAAWNRYTPLPQETRAKIYAASPAFAELQPFLEGEIGQKWTGVSMSRFSAAMDGRPDIAGGLFVWAVLDAVKEAGHYRSGQTAARYYTRLASEVNAACEGGRLHCYSPQENSAITHWSRLMPYIWQSSVELGRCLLTSEQNQPMQPPSQLDDTEQYLLFLDVTLSNVAAPAGQVLPTINQNRINQFKIRVLDNIYLMYRGLVPLLYGGAAVCLLLVAGFLLLKRRVTPLLMITSAVLSIILLRILGLAYVDATACFGKPYLGPVYPLALVASFLLIVNAAEIIGSFTKR